MFDFSVALAHLKTGKRVCRQGWNGKGMYIYLERFEAKEDNQIVFLPCITMFTADFKWQRGWLASQADLLAIDWQFADIEKYSVGG